MLVKTKSFTKVDKTWGSFPLQASITLYLNPQVWWPLAHKPFTKQPILTNKKTIE